MTVYRMTFDIAVTRGAPDVYTLESEIRRAIYDGVPLAIGAEGVKGNGLRVNGIDASGLIDKQIKENSPIDIEPQSISYVAISNCRAIAEEGADK